MRLRVLEVDRYVHDDDFSGIEVGEAVTITLDGIVIETSIDVVDVTGHGDTEPQMQPGERRLVVMPTHLERRGGES